MPNATVEQRNRARKAAALTALVVCAFAGCFLALCVFLNNTAMSKAEQEVQIADQDDAFQSPFYVLLIGSDTRKGTALYTGKATEHAQVNQHSDVMTIMRIDPNTYTVSLLTVPRDTVISVGGEKINNALLEDNPEEVVDAVEALTGLRVDYYMMTTFGMFADLIDAIGGITMDVAQDVTVDDPSTGGNITVKAGKNRKLKGAQALALARARVEYDSDQDAVRQVNVRDIEQAIIERMLEGDGIGIEALLVVLEHDVDTNMDLSLMGSAVVDFMENADKVTIYSGTGPYSGDVRDDDEQWVIQNDEMAWKKIMLRFKAGKDFSKVVEQPTIQVAEQGASNSSAASKYSRSSSAASKSYSSASKSAKSAK